MTTWLEDASANRHIKTYVKDFLDLSGNFTVRTNYEDYKWNSYGQLMSGVYESDGLVYYGVTVDMDATGTTIAVGAHYDNTDGAAGVVRVYKYDSDAEVWYQHGNTVLPDTSIDYNFGWTSVWLSDDGTILGVTDHGSKSSSGATNAGKFYVFQYNAATNNWDTYGTNQEVMEGIASEWFGNSGSVMSADGSTVLLQEIGANDSIRYFKLHNGAWLQAAAIYLPYYPMQSALNYNGNRVMFNDVSAQVAYVFDFIGDGTGFAGSGVNDGTAWTQVGSAIPNSGGTNIAAHGSMNYAGDIVAVGENTGYTVSVYQFVDTDWVKLGSTLTHPEGSTSQFGRRTRLNAAGDMIIIGAAGADTADIFKYQNGDWVQIGDKLTGNDGSQFGRGVAISDDGTKIVVGGYLADLNGTNSGYVQAFQWSREPTGGIFMDISGGLTIDCHSNDNLTKDTFAQLGSTLTGSSDNFGYTVNMNYTGDMMIVGRNTGTSAKAYPTVYKYTNGQWSQVGTNVYGENSTYFSMISLISNDGTVIAASSHTSVDGGSEGAIHVYEFINGDWSLKGSAIQGSGSGAYFSIDGMELSGDGTVVAGVSRTNYAKVFKYVEDSTNDWVQMGSDFTINPASSALAVTMSSRVIGLSDDGTVFAASSTGDDTTGTDNGKVEVYKFTGDVDTGSWNQLGSTIYGVARSGNTYEGMTLKLSADGTILATGSWYYNSSNGYIRVFKYSEAAGDWCQMGADIQNNIVAGNAWARGFDMSSDGKTLAVGEANADEGYNNAGGTDIFKYINGQWVYIEHIASTYTTTNTYLGKYVTISGDGKRFAAGTNTNPGIVEAWEIINHNQPALKVKHGRAILGGNLTVSQNVGIGTSIPSTTLDVWGYNLNSNTVDYVVNPITYSTSSTEVQEGIGTGITFDVERAKDNFYPTGTFTGWGCAAIRLWGSNNIPGTSDQWSMAFITRENDTMKYNLSIRYDGNIGINQTNPGTRCYVSGNGRAVSLSSSSDDRLKVNEQKIEGALTTLQKLVPQTYTKYEHFDISGNKTTTDLSSNSVFEAGLIAQEIYYNAPELRHLITAGDDASANNFHPQEYDLSGNDIQHDPDYTALGWGTQPVNVKYTELIPYLIKAIQEEQDMIASQKTRIEDITSRVTALKNK